MRRYNRRRLLTSGAAAGVLAAAGLPLGASAAQSGGRFVAGLSGASATDTWDSRSHKGHFMMAAGHGAVFDCLTEIAADGSLTGELATDWEASPDATTWVFNLRRGVAFHDGGGFTAADVLASFALHSGGSGSPAEPLLASVIAMTATGPHQVRFELAEGNADFPYLLSDPRLVIYPADRMHRAMTEGIGTGLYRVAHFKPGVRFVGRRVSDHYKDGRAGWFEEIVFVAMHDAQARVQALQSGGVDAIDEIGPDAGRALDPALLVQEVMGNRHLWVAPHPEMEVRSATHLRSALKFGLDRSSLLRDLAGGHGQPASDSPIGPANQYRVGLPPVLHDPDRAAYHLRKAGLDPSALDLGQPHLKSRYSSGRVTEDWMLTSLLGTLPETQTKTHLLRLTAAARSALDPARRRDLYAEIQHSLREKDSTTIPFFANWIQAHGPRVATPHQIGNVWAMDNARMAERWWSA